MKSALCLAVIALIGNVSAVSLSRHHHQHPPRSALVQKESDDVANADAADDKEIESELGDGEDEIVTDNGFALAAGNFAGDENNVKAGQYDLSTFGPKFGLEPWVLKSTPAAGGGDDAKPAEKK